MDPLLHKAPENMSLSVDSSLHSGQVPTRITPSGYTNADVRSVGFRDSLGHRNIYINHIKAPNELMKRAKEVITAERLSGDMDDTTAQIMAANARDLATGTEQDIITQLGAKLIPAMGDVPHQSLQSSTDKLWANAVALPLKPDVYDTPPPLSRPKPDLVFGYSKIAFNTKQETAINSLVDQLGQKYAMPDGKVRFPFLGIEFKSQAVGGTHFIAANQVANAGAIAIEGTLQLVRRISAEENLDFDEPQFFSLSIDHAMAYVNVHWLSKNAEDGAICFQMEQLLLYALDAAGIKAINRAVKNILDYGVNKRLPKICGELDTCAQKRIEEKATSHKDNLASKSPPQKQQQQPRRRRNAHSLANGQQAL